MKTTLTLLLALLLTGCLVVPTGRVDEKSGGSSTVCHKGKKTMELPESAVRAHLDHGDRLGPC